MTDTTFIPQQTRITAEWLNETNKDLRGRLRDIRTFTGIVADNATDDFVALQAAFVTARDSGCGIFWPAGVKTFVQFSATHPHMFIDGPMRLEGADRYTSGISFHCNYDMGNVHAPLFCWGIPSKGSAVNKVRGAIRGLGWFLKAGSSKFERANHVYGFQELAILDCYCDMASVTWPAADGGHPSGYQAGGWWSSNVQAAFATGQTRDRGLRFEGNVGFALAEYQNAESVGFTRVDNVRYLNNYLTGWSDDMAVHECTDVIFRENYYAAVAGRLYFDNSRNVKIVKNHITAIAKPSGGYLGPVRTYITGNMITQYAASTTDDPNEDVLIHGNTIILPTSGYCSAAILMYGVQDGLTISKNTIWNWGCTSPAGAITVSSMYRAGWTGSSWNQDFGAGGAIKLRSCEITDNKCLGPGWSPGDGNVGVVVYAGGAAGDIIGPVRVEGNIAGAYYMPYEAIHFGQNYAIRAVTDPFLNVSLISLWDKQPAMWVGLLPAAANINNTNFPQGTPTFYTLLDSDGLKFIAQRAGRVCGAHMQLTANMTAGNNAVLRVMKNGVQIGTDTDSSTNSPTTNPSRYTWNFFGVASMTFVEGDLIECLLTIRVAQGATAIAGRLNLIAVYS